MLPAKPAAWPKGSVTGLRARGDVGVDVTWAPDRTDFTLRPDRSGTLTVRCRVFTGTYTLTDTTTGQPVTVRRDGNRVMFTVTAGHAYRAVGQAS